MNNTAENTRQYPRFPAALKGLYFIDDKKGEGKECIIINISVNGAGLKFYAREAIIVNSKLFLEIYLPDGKGTITVEGIIRWANQAAKDCVCGIQLTEKLNEAQMAILKV